MVGVASSVVWQSSFVFVPASPKSFNGPTLRLVIFGDGKLSAAIKHTPELGAVVLVEVVAQPLRVNPIPAFFVAGYRDLSAHGLTI
jgi:hypothetical protein